MSAAQNKALVARYFDEVLSKGNLDVLDELLVPDYVDHGAFPGQPPGIEGLKQAFFAISSSFPDIVFRIEDLIAEDDKVVARGVLEGTHTGDFMGIPATGRRIHVTGTRVFRVRDGKLVENWSDWDGLGLIQQLGAMPAHASA